MGAVEKGGCRIVQDGGCKDGLADALGSGKIRGIVEDEMKRGRDCCVGGVVGDFLVRHCY